MDTVDMKDIYYEGQMHSWIGYNTCRTLCGLYVTEVHTVEDILNADPSVYIPHCYACGDKLNELWYLLANGVIENVIDNNQGF